MQRLRNGEDLFKLPGVAETIDWAQALSYLDKTELTAGDVDETLGVLLKYQDDIAKLKVPRQSAGDRGRYRVLNVVAIEKTIADEHHPSLGSMNYWSNWLMRVAGTSEAESHRLRLVEQVAAGEPFIVAKVGSPSLR